MLTNYTEEKQVIEHFRDLILFSDILDKGYDVEMLEFIHKLKDHGWGSSQIDRFITIAGYGTFWEDRIESPLPNVGDQIEWRRNKFHWKK